MKGFCALALMTVVFSCSTEKNKFFNRSYHNTTARYNGYFNAGEVIKEALIDFHATNKDDYTKILPVFIIPDDARSKSLYAPMDKAILKTGNVIKKHSMPNPEKKANKKEEWCKWIDNNWMIMGQAYFYKRDFNEARTRFEYVFKQYQAEPIKYEAWLWEAKTFMELGDYVNAQTYLDKLQEKFEEQTDKAKIAAKKKKDAAKKAKNKGSKTKIPNLNPDMDSKMYDDIQMTWADFYLRKKEYTKAEERIKKALKVCKNKKQKARLHFILGQLYQAKGDRSGANLQYLTVDKLNPEYEMEFYARIFRALNYDGGNSVALKRQLLKMAKDEKNKDYLDQIYYALAEIELRENNEPGGITYLQKSVKFSTTNNRQKGLSYKRLGDLYYGKKKFIQAKTYYDSTMANLPQEFENYDKVREKAESLKDLVVNLLVIQTEDSLAKLRTMPKDELEKYIDKLIADRKAEEERKRQEQENALAKEPVVTPTTNTSSWYFYNPTAMAQGFAAFKKVWGVRKLEDNWRRSDKSSTLEFTDDTTGTNTNTAATDDPLKEREAMMAKILVSDKELAANKMKLIDALYDAGTIYNDRLKEEKLAVECFERIVKDYNESKQGLPSHFQLYVIKKETETGAHATYILTNHPESEYAKIIRNPNYKKDEANAKIIDQRRYEEVFVKYKKKEYENTLLACNDIISNDPKNTLLPRYYYLRALTYGEMDKRAEFETALSETASKYPKEEVGIAAAELLDLLRKDNSKRNAELGTSTYIYESDIEHLFVLVFTSKLGSVNDAKAKMSNFHSASFSLDGLKITNTFLNTDDQLIMVKRFDNAKKAMEYYDAFKRTDMLKGLNDKADYFVITNKNYASLYIEKNVADYIKFFKENYFK